MNYYINKTPSETGNYGSVATYRFKDAYSLPENLMEQYLNAKGFVVLTVNGDIITGLEVNETALADYIENHPDNGEQPTDNLESRVDALERSQNEIWDRMAKAYQEGVQNA